MMMQKKAISGILWVNADVIEPSKLSREEFDQWYCDEHIPDVVATSGVSSAIRYQYKDDAKPTARRLRFLTIYEMPDLNFMQSKEFKSLEGQSPGPNQEKIFKNAEFDTRAYILVQVDEVEGEENLAPANTILCVAMAHISDPDMNNYVKEIGELSGYRRTRRFNLLSRTILSRFLRSVPESSPTSLVIHEFNVQDHFSKGLNDVRKTEWMKNVLWGIQSVDFGCCELMGVFTKTGR